MVFRIQSAGTSALYAAESKGTGTSQTGNLFPSPRKAKLLAACGAYGEAERLCEEIEQGYRSENSGWVHFFEEVYLLQAEIQLKLGNAEAAVHKAEESTAIAENMRGENAKETLGCWEILADAYAAAGRREEADRLYQKVLEKLSFYYPLQKEWHESVYRKERANH